MENEISSYYSGLIKIRSNGSKWGGEKPDGINKLIERLRKHKLEEFSERLVERDEVQFWGNFKNLSAVFKVYVQLGSELEKELTRLFDYNKKLADYN